MSSFQIITIAFFATIFVYFLVWLMTFAIVEAMGLGKDILKKLQTALKILGLIYFIPIILLLYGFHYSPWLFSIVFLVCIALTYPSYRIFRWHIWKT